MNSTFLILAAALLLVDTLANEAPTARAPWKIEVLASSPAIRHPSVVCAAPDGRIFVAEDPMDISAPANASQGRIITFHPDGRRTIFATNLFAVFGMQYLEGKLYVLHNPRFTTFKDSGDIGTDPEDIIKSTNPNPWALDWNDHVPANFKLAMDGYFYMAVGDKGIYHAQGKDGRIINLHGGGILRIKPDGTDAEVFSTGVRNILDVAITSEDEIFTYDNTDEHDWMGRLTHMVDGGFYGYPHHFLPRRPYTLWMMHDFGGGAATGTFANTEDALPADYHDNLFLADFGKRQIIRVIIERDGATFRVVRHEELFSEIPDSFRPVGIAPSHDGKSIYICDWQHRDTKENVEVGRLWKLTYGGETYESAKPSWYVPTALGKKSEATDQQLSDGLAHPSRNVRLAAQRELGRRRVLSSPRQDGHPAAIWHSLWAWPFVPEESTQLTLSSNATMQRQQLRAFALFPSRDAQRLAILSLKDSDASVRFHGATTLGRLKDENSPAISALLKALPEKDPFTRFAIEKALNRLGRKNAASWKLLVSSLTNRNGEIRVSIAHALRETYEAELATELQRFIRLSHVPDFSRAAAISLLAQILRKVPEWKGEWWAYHPALAPAPVKTVTWEATESSLALFKNLLREEPELRLSALRALAQAQETSLAPDIRDLYVNGTPREACKEIIHALTVFKDTNSATIVLAGLKSSDRDLNTSALALARFSSSPEVLVAIARIIESTAVATELRLEAINVSGLLRNDHALPAIIAVAKSADSKLRGAAISALGKMGGPVAAKTLLSFFELPEPELHLEAANALAEIKDLSSLEPEFQRTKADLVVKQLLSLYTEERTRAAALEALLKIPDPSAVDVYLDALGNANPTTRVQARKHLETFRTQALPTVRSRIRNMPPVVLAEIEKIYPQERDITLIAREKTIPTVNDYIQAALRNKGNTHRGRRVFRDQTGVACIQCHTVAGEGNAVGPDMTTIGAQFPRPALVEHIIDPSKSVREGYQQVLIETDDDENYAGLIKSETGDTLTILTAQAKLQTIPKTKITSRHNSALSLMPDGLHLGLSLGDFTDLIAYLESLKTDSRPQPK